MIWKKGQYPAGWQEGCKTKEISIPDGVVFSYGGSTSGG